MPRVGSLMLSEVRASDEGLPTLLTLIGLLTSVDFLVSTKLRASAEGLSALLALIGLFATVASFMVC